ncbi:MAG: hypothetical protein LBC67_02760 [Spirochaetales bacterium]|jgi:hypothetical protein|nr:hypothetical protein [Spirochaetales bacterium]
MQTKKYGAARPLLFAFFLAAGCATLEKGAIPEESLWEEPEPLEAGLATDIFQLRLDLVRERGGAASSSTTSTILVQNDGTYKTEGAYVPHNYLGVYIGNGLFIDINGNIGVDLIRLFGFDRKRSFRLTRTRKGSLDAAQEYIRDGNSVIIKKGGWGSGELKCTISPEGISLSSSTPFFSPDQIRREEEGLSFVPSGLFSNFRSSSIKEAGGLFHTSTTCSLESLGPDNFNVNSTHEIIREKNKILIRTRARTLFTMVKSGDRYVFFISQSQGSWVEKKGNKLIISDSGSLTEYEFETLAGGSSSEAPESPRRKIKRPKAQAGARATINRAPRE